MTVKDGLDLFLVDKELQGCTDKTILNYKQFITYFINFIGDDFIVDNITLHTLKSYQLYLNQKNKFENHPFKIKTDEKGISKISIQSYIRHLRAFINYLQEEDYIEEDLTKKYRLPKSPKKVFDILSEEEIETLLNYYKENTELKLRNKLMICLMLDSGLRRNELIQINIDDINLSNGYIKINGKGQKQRLTPIGLKSKKLLLKYINQFRSMPEYETNKLFLDKNKKPITESAITNMFRRLKKSTKIERLHPHLLRHTFATLYLVNGGDIFSLQQILGHTSLNMVRRYSHLANSFVLSNHKLLSPLDSHIKHKHNFN